MEQTTYQNWNLDTLYAGGSQSIELKNLITELKDLLDNISGSLNDQEENIDTQAFLKLINQFQHARNAWDELDDFVICVYSQDVTDNDAVVLLDESAVIKAKLDSVQIDLDEALANFPETRWNEFIELEEVKPYSFYLEERRKTVKDRLPVEMERLINVLSVNGIKAWEQQQQQLLAKLKIPIGSNGEEQGVSIGQAMNRAMYAEDRSHRQKAAGAIAETCAVNAEDFATALNRISGFRLDVYEQRCWDNVLKEAVEQNRIQEESIQALMESIDGNKDLYRAYFQRKVALTGLDEISWFDLETPTFASEKKIDYAAAKDIIIKQFHQFSEKLGQFAERAFEEGWIETENRPDKAGGGFCASMPLSKESRIFMTYRENYQDVVTLAHEFGHAYHNYILQEEPAFAQQKGTSVAESASTFLENLVLDAAIEHTEDEKEKLALLEVKIKDGLKYVVSVPNMFRFEQEFYARRKHGQLTVKEINNLIKDVESDFYGGIIEGSAPYKWMYISHFYSADKPFYNIPYTIGYLFSNGIYSLAKEATGDFQEKYDELLRNSGRMTVEQLAQNYLDADVTKPEFWNASQQALKEAIEEYLRLTEKYIE
ncbi:M3 family oligoendopeptidase [Planomicrobium okeanokoites]|uniref:M3 family oligoendopeptidase n=1 Tax=Planomicrobium okeanokoites TaxID=244 RepID=UPI0024917CAD|nr:M3 family oligoendopeptidase [Planomicrobium okeanokoites]